MLDGVFDDGLQDHAGHQAVERVLIDLFQEAQLVAEADDLDGQIVVDERDLFAERSEALGFSKQPAKDIRQFVNHAAGAVGIDANERGNRVQCVEQKMRVDLIRQRGQARFGQARVLRLQLAFGAIATPDAKRQRDREESGSRGGRKHPRVQPAPFKEKERAMFGEQSMNAPAEEFGDNHQRVAHYVKHREFQNPALNRAAVQPQQLPEQTIKIQIHKWGEIPDIFAARRKVMHQRADNPGGGKQRHGHELASEHARQGDAQAGDQAADVTPQHPGDDGSFHGEIDCGILIRQDAYFRAGTEQNGKDESKLEPVGDSTLVQQQYLLHAGEAHQNAGNGGGDGHLDEERGKLLLSKHAESKSGFGFYNKGLARAKAEQGC